MRSRMRTIRRRSTRYATPAPRAIATIGNVVIAKTQGAPGAGPECAANAYIPSSNGTAATAISAAADRQM